MKIKGVSYDVGRVMGMNWRPVFEPKIVQRELEIIKEDLNCNSVRICGYRIERLMIASEIALKIGLHVWLSPEIWDKSQKRTEAYVLSAASMAEKLRIKYPDQLVFSIGSEYTLFMQGILPGKSLMRRVRHPLFWENVKAGNHNGPLNNFLKQLVDEVRKVFQGPLTYAALIWENVDWEIFDYVGVDHYYEERIKDEYAEMLAPLFEYHKPVINTEFGCRTYTGAEKAGAMGFGIINFMTLGLHQIPLVGKWIKPRIKGVHERNEDLQSSMLRMTLEILDNAGVDGTYVMTFVSPLFPFDDNSRYDLDMSSFSLVKSFTNKYGLTYPDLKWEPKKSFYAVADFYKRH